MECRQAVLLSACLPLTIPIISSQSAAVAQTLMCFLPVLSHLLFDIVVLLILNESSQTQSAASLWDFQYYVGDFSITINQKTFECHTSDIPNLFDALLALTNRCLMQILRSDTDNAKRKKKMGLQEGEE